MLARMEKIGMTFLIHGEEADPEIDVFDREAVFIERRLIADDQGFPGLCIVLEHVSSQRRRGVRARQRAASRRHHHALSSDADAHRLAGLRQSKPYMYCMPVIKRREDRDALAQSGDLRRILTFFLGTDLAPHPVTKKLNVVGAAGLFNSPVAIEILRPGLRRGECAGQARSFRLIERPQSITACPPNTETITLGAQQPGPRPKSMKIDGPGRARPRSSRRRNNSVESRRALSARESDKT